ncbi:MAG: aminoacetone oxidase family FAD-binding enzyme [Arcobacteraceae bacterium]|nr:aminoacetone oxidase family FAD-binding enzyme [Arcobacteraceae bacterium]
MFDIVIIGAGASGLMTASQLPNQKICFIDKNKNIGEKIKISGGAKCNITNKYLNENFYLGDKNFIKNTFKIFNHQDLLKFLNKNRVYPSVKEKIVKGTYFCSSSQDVLNMFKKLTSFCTFKMATEVIDVTYLNHFEITTNKGLIKTKKLIIASGGLSYPSLGATDIGFKIATKFGHNIIKPNPALVGFTVQKDQFWFKELSGLSLDVKITINDKVLEGSMLFTHKGCSGPVILSTSLYWGKGQISIDFAPNKDSYLPKRFKKAIQNLTFNIHNYKFSPAGNFGYTKAEVTKGGVDTTQLTSNFESIFQKDLYFIGEIIDVTGELGGYNFQWAFSSAVACARNI